MQRLVWVINCAVYTQVDRAESEEEETLVINRDCVAQLAGAVAGYGGNLLHVSTDFVFDGKHSRPYREEDDTRPLGVYGRSKWEGEQTVRAVLPEAIIQRTASVYAAHGHDFVKKPSSGSPAWASP